ncbi:hypothetical protein Celaphus_00014163, partial [Cervus elaphus hippelaphus]
MFDDYVLYLLESLHCQERANELMRAMKGEGSTAKSAASVEVPPPSSPVSNPSPEYTGLSTTDDYVLDSKELNFHLRKIKAWKGKQILLPHTLARVIKDFDSPPPVDPHVGGAGEPGVEDVDAADGVGALDALLQGGVVVKPEPLSEPVHGVHPHPGGGGGRGARCGAAELLRGEIQGRRVRLITDTSDRRRIAAPKE